MSDFEIPNEKKPSFKQKGQSPAELKTSDIPGEKEAAAGEEKEKPQYSKEELLRVFDEIIFSGEYTEQYVIRGRLPVTFRTRTGEDVNAIQKAIDSAGLNLISSVETMRSIMNLQYSLASYDKKDLTVLKLEERSKVIERLPGPIIGLLIGLMSKFDHKVAEACREGEENF